MDDTVTREQLQKALRERHTQEVQDKLDKARTEMSVLIQLFLIYRLKPARKEIFNEQNYYHRTGI